MGVWKWLRSPNQFVPIGLVICSVCALVLVGEGPVRATDVSRQLFKGEYFCPFRAAEPQIEAPDGTTYITGNVRSTDLPQVFQFGNFSTLYIQSGGGSTEAHLALAARFEKVRVLEKCVSACAWMVTLSNNVCIDDTVSTIDYHSSVTMWCHSDGTRIISDDAITERLNRTPLILRAKLAELHKEERIVSIPRDEFLEMFPEKAC